MNITAAIVMNTAMMNLLRGSFNDLFFVTREKKTPTITTSRYLVFLAMTCRG